MKKIRHIRFLYIWIAVLLAVSPGLQIPAYAVSSGGTKDVSGEERQEDAADTDSPEGQQAKTKTSEETEIQVFIQDSGQKKEGAVPVSSLRITIEEEELPAAEGCADQGNDDRRIAEAVEDASYVPAAYETASVTTAEGITWEIPLFWTDGDNTLAEKRKPGRNYKPVLAFFVPEEYAVQKNAEKGFTVTLDAGLSGFYEAAGGAVCFYEPQTNITYILAAGTDLEFLEGNTEKLPSEPIPGLPDDLQKPSDGTYHNPSTHSGSALSGGGENTDSSGDSAEGKVTGIGDPRGKGDGRSTGESTGSSGAASSGASASDTSSDTSSSGTKDEDSQTEDSAQKENSEETSPADDQEEAEEQEESLTREQLLGHCASNTLKKYGEDEMANLVDLIINCIQPQAVNLIREKFPAFAQAADEDALGKEIGLYVYRLYGDKDGVKAHGDTSLLALAYVGYDIAEDGQGEAELGYVIGLNTYYFQYKDDEGNLHIDTSEQAAADLDNSIVHEMFHAFMYDYNRTGSIGTTNPEDYFKTEEALQDVRDVYEFPAWFKEGIASAVENVYQYRYEYFQLLRYEGAGVIGDRHTAYNLLNTYLTNQFLLENGEEHEDSYDIGSEEQTTTSTYVTGYLADLYLGELAARYENSLSSVSVDESGSRKVSSETIRMGLNSILERLHKGETLDEIICSISDGRYQNVSDFEQKFIKGTDQEGDEDSISFCVDFLNYMRDIGTTSTYIPNGSILFDFDRDFTTPIDRSVTAGSDLYQITDSSDYVASTAALEIPYTDGGKSEPAEASDAAAAANTDQEDALRAAKESSREIEENVEDHAEAADSVDEAVEDHAEAEAKDSVDEAAEDISEAKTADSVGEAVEDISEAEAKDSVDEAAEKQSDAAVADQPEETDAAAESAAEETPAEETPAESAAQDMPAESTVAGETDRSTSEEPASED